MMLQNETTRVDMTQFPFSTCPYYNVTQGKLCFITLKSFKHNESKNYTGAALSQADSRDLSFFFVAGRAPILK